MIAGSIAANGGRSCINASGVWTPSNAEAIADALAQRFAKVAPLPVDDPEATIAAFASAAMAQSISEAIDHDLKTDGAIDVTQQRRGSPRLVHRGRVAYLLPTIIRCDDRNHALANREFLFPFASVVTCETGQMAEAIVKDKRRILPCAAWLQGEYGFNDLYLGVPCMLGENGIEKIIEVELDEAEQAALAVSAEHVRSTVAALKALEA